MRFRVNGDIGGLHDRCSSRATGGGERMTYEEKKNVVIDNYFQQDCDINTTIKEAYTKGFNRGADKQRSVVEAKRKEIDSLKEKCS